MMLGIVSELVGVDAGGDEEGGLGAVVGVKAVVQDFLDRAFEAGRRVGVDLDQGEASDFERAPVDIPQVDLAEEDNAVDDMSRAPPPPPPDLNHPLERKLALAKEFLEIGDLEGARDLLDEVYAQATGPLKDSASLLLDTLE